MRVDIADPDQRLVAYRLLEHGQGVAVTVRGHRPGRAPRRVPPPGPAGPPAPPRRPGGSARPRRAGGAAAGCGVASGSHRPGGHRHPGRRPPGLRPGQHRRTGGVLGHRRVPGLPQRAQHPADLVRGDQHRRREPAQRQLRQPPVGQHLGQQRLVVAAQVRPGGADPQPAVLAGHVVDQVGQPLRHRRTRPAPEQRVQVVGGVAGVQRPAHAARGDPVHARPAGRLGLGDQVQFGGERRLRRPGYHHGQVGLHQEVVDRGGQQRVQRPDRRARRPRRRSGARAGRRRRGPRSRSPRPAAAARTR